MTDAQFGAFIRFRREDMGYSAKDLASDCNFSPQHLSDIEAGRRRASEKVLWALAYALELDVFALHAMTGRIPHSCRPKDYDRAVRASKAFRDAAQCAPRRPV